MIPNLDSSKLQQKERTKFDFKYFVFILFEHMYGTCEVYVMYSLCNVCLPEVTAVFFYCTHITSTDITCIPIKKKHPINTATTNTAWIHIKQNIHPGLNLFGSLGFNSHLVWFCFVRKSTTHSGRSQWTLRHLTDQKPCRSGSDAPTLVHNSR